ncbi:MAG: amidophosphoribosyltransferase [Syntrophus sp. (in: bacteria)]|nr:amidophosphoribosyltransferase [Syntrophus sp. (in: bacteria)]
MKEILTGIADLIFPPRCTTCDVILKERSRLPFCPHCTAGIRFIRSPLCPRCGIPFTVTEGEDHLCGECLMTQRPYAVARAVGLYEETLLTAIHLFKYQGRIGIGKVLGNIMADFAGGIWDMNVFSVIMPVPLHLKRLRERGFNQAVILAREIATRFFLPIDFLTLRRTVFTESQVRLGREDRSVNVRGAFAVRKPERAAGKSILLVDDVYTTGSTLTECARTLLTAGADSVAVLTLAKAVSDHDEPGNGRKLN